MASNAKANYIGAPATFALEMACKQLRAAFMPPDDEGFGSVFLVGSSIERADWRDVDVRLILDDASFQRLFPDAQMSCAWEFDPRWTLMTVAITEWLRKQTGLPIDFQFQPLSHANERHDKPRHAMGLTYVSSRSSVGGEG